MTGLQRGFCYGLLIMLVFYLLAWTAYTHAATAPPLFTVAEQHAGLQVANPSRFEAIIGQPNQCVAGISCWTYTKGTRSGRSTWPESWYLHVNGVRVRDNVFHLYVMDPRSTGWQQQVASACPQQCFLDGMGTSSLNRDTPNVAWTKAQWIMAVAGVVRAVVASGKQALPNSVGLAADGQPLVTAAGRGSTEAFNVRNAQSLLGMGSIWVSEISDCVAKYAAYQQYRGATDHFACYERGSLPWDTSWLTS